MVAGVVLPEPNPATTTPRAPPATACSSAEASAPRYWGNTSTRGSSDVPAGSSGCGRGAPRRRNPASSTCPTGPYPGASKACSASVCDFRTPTAGRISSAKATVTPVSTASGEAAQRSATARLRGPSGAGSSNGRCAPVSTTGRGPEWVSASRNATSSSVSVPWVSTTPSTSAAASATASASRSTSGTVAAKLGMPARSRGRTSRSPRSNTDPAASARVAAPTSTRRPPSASRVAIVPPVASRTRCCTEPPLTSA